MKISQKHNVPNNDRSPINDPVKTSYDLFKLSTANHNLHSKCFDIASRYFTVLQEHSYFKPELILSISNSFWK